MPLPKPRSNEPKEKFIERCMSELSGEYPDRPQRFAICNNSWRADQIDKKENAQGDEDGEMSTL